MCTPLQKKIINTIHKEGPIPLQTYMQICLSDPEHGYYMQHDPFGAENDFITAPELGSLFARTLSQWLVQLWQDLKKPKPFFLCELGAGHGHLMRDIQNHLQQISPDLCKNLQSIIIETSPRLQQIQKQNIPHLYGHYKDLNQLPSQPIVFIANEFFDALPVDQYIKRNNQFYQLCVDIKDDQFFLTPSATILPQAQLPPQAALCADGTIFEYSPLRLTYFNQILTHLKTQSGAALLIDYGEIEQGFGDTLQAVHRHLYIDIFSKIGQADLTSHVDFASFSRLAIENNFHITTWPQGEFLCQFGIQNLVEQDLQNHSQQTAQIELMREYRRLVDPQLMGQLFKVMCVSQQILSFQERK